jgi:hypothetical protein
VFEFLRIIFAIVAIFAIFAIVAIFAVLFFVLFLSFCLIHIVHVFTKYLCDVSIIDDVFLVLPLSHTLCFFSLSPSLSPQVWCRMCSDCTSSEGTTCKSRQSAR